MNERIKEPYYSLMYKASEGWNDHLFQVPPELLEKFAQLIVQECAKKGFDIFDEEPDAPASDLQFYVRDRILQHFGVEE